VTDYKEIDKEKIKIIGILKKHKVICDNEKCRHNLDGCNLPWELTPLLKEAEERGRKKGERSMGEKIREIIGENENLYEKERKSGEWDWRVQREEGGNEVRNKIRKELGRISPQ